jgi:hypothetical protein
MLQRIRYAGVATRACPSRCRSTASTTYTFAPRLGGRGWGRPAVDATEMLGTADRLAAPSAVSADPVLVVAGSGPTFRYTMRAVGRVRGAPAPSGGDRQPTFDRGNLGGLPMPVAG